MNKSEIMTDQSLREYHKQFLTNVAISTSNLRGSFYVRSLEGEGTFRVSLTGFQIVEASETARAISHRP